MLVFEGEFSVLVVVEACVLPALFSVAGITLCTVTPAMLVITFMAAVAVLFGFYLVYGFLMTAHTDNLFMLAF
jgi:hypothetical protein